MTVIEFTPTSLGGHRAALGEGPIWDARRSRLHWIDILGQRLLSCDENGAPLTDVKIPLTPGTLMPTTTDDTLIATDRGLALWDGSTLTELESGLAARSDLRFNDGKVDPRGRVVVGTLSLVEAENECALWSYDAPTQGREIVSPVTLSNGLGWSPDGGTFYYVDTPTGRIDAFDYDLDTGNVSARRVFARVPAGQGMPDGLCVDHDGGVWVALWGGYGVLRFAADGRLDARVAFDIPNITSCAFGGMNGEKLFITTAAVDLAPSFLESHPEAGTLHVVDVGRTGPAATLWSPSGDH